MINRIVMATTALALLATAVGAADPGNDHRTVVRKTVIHRTVVNNWAPRSDFRSGGHVGQDDWRRGRVIDYRVGHLRAPPPGYEWREVGGRYVLAAVATGLITDIILNSR